MAVRLEAQLKRFSGLSTDQKPEPYSLGGNMAEGEALPAGSTFYETDTKQLWLWEGANWEPKENVEGVLLRLLEETIAMRKLLEVNLA